MNFESMKQMLQGMNMEEVPYHLYSGISNILCKEDGFHISTIEILEDENGSGELVISERALKMLQRAIEKHQLQEHEQIDKVLLLEGVSEVTSKTAPL